MMSTWETNRRADGIHPLIVTQYDEEEIPGSPFTPPYLSGMAPGSSGTPWYTHERSE